MKVIKITLKILHGFLALSAIGGGIGLLTGVAAPPQEMISGTMFESYLIPGLSLLVLVGGSAAAAFILFIMNNPKATSLSFAAAIILGIFITVEILTIGSPEGVGKNLQILYMFVAVLIGFYTSMLRKMEDQVDLPRPKKKKQEETGG
ncbi:MAG: hypothetical protein HUU54_07470 [Ignavibacteriaceae bacterium]|nr:hypothetical protein [Ignavibacteriaceae bacterium]